ncbi:unnamed protein product [Urochloa humidicola]
MVTVARCCDSSQGVAVSPAVNVGWASFDPCVVLGEVAPSSTTAVCKTTNGRQVRVALRFAAPPAASYVHLDTDDCARGGDPTVVSADGNVLLIHMLVKAEGVPSWRFSDNFFVCKADPERPWLECLPCLGGWIGVARHTGVTLSGENDFFVADLQPRVVKLSAGGSGVVAELFRYRSATKQWELKRLDMPDLGPHPICWETDTVFSFRGLMCWADYHRGFLVCNVSADDPDLRFVRFPGIEIRYNFKDGRGLTEKYRTASVSKGRIWFVDVDDGRFRSTHTFASCTITTWTLKTPELQWVKEHTLHLSELWSHRKYELSALPRCVPGFPIVDMQQDDVLHFIVQQESAASRMDWTITVNMKNRCLMACELYQNAIEDPESDMDLSNIFLDSPLVCCQCI